MFPDLFFFFDLLLTQAIHDSYPIYRGSARAFVAGAHRRSIHQYIIQLITTSAASSQKIHSRKSANRSRSHPQHFTTAFNSERTVVFGKNARCLVCLMAALFSLSIPTSRRESRNNAPAVYGAEAGGLLRLHW